ncbi:MAG: hypothetical protein RJA25_2425, partial [Bacteroidota bacterium]
CTNIKIQKKERHLENRKKIPIKTLKEEG